MASSFLRRVRGLIVRSSLRVRLMSSSSRNITSPWLILPEASEGGKTVDRFYSLTEKKVLSLERSRGGGGGYETVGSSHGWLALFNDVENHLFLLNPLTGRSIDLPPILTLPDPDFKAREGRGRVRRVILSRSPEDEEDEEEEECMAIMCFGQGDNLAFCFPGHRRSKWTTFGFTGDHDPVLSRMAYGDFTYSTTRKVVTCISETECNTSVRDWDLRGPHPVVRLSASDLTDFRRVLIEKRRNNKRNEDHKEKEEPYVIDTLHFGSRAFDTPNLNYVVNYTRDQFFVVRRYVNVMEGQGRGRGRGGYNNKTIGFDVFKVDRDGMSIQPMHSNLYGLAIFVGLSHNFALPAAAAQLKPDSIYFSKSRPFDPVEENWDIWDSCEGHDSGVFDAKTRVITPLDLDYPAESADYDTVKIKRRIYPVPMWFTPTHI